MENFNKLSPAEDERLAILMEECAEVIQVIGKILRHGYDSRHPDGGPTNRESLCNEIGDIFAALELMEKSSDVSPIEIMEFKNEKLKKIGKYLHHQN